MIVKQATLMRVQMQEVGNAFKINRSKNFKNFKNKIKLTGQQLKITLYAMSYLMRTPNYKTITDKHTKNRKSNPSATLKIVIKS